MIAKKKLIGYGSLALILSLSCQKFLKSTHNPQNPLPKIYQIKHLALQNQEGEIFSKESMKGSIWIVNFIFTRCQGPCPLLTKTMGQLQKNLKSYSKIKYLSISADPRRDQPQDLKKYAIKQKADFKKWTFLTGKLEDVIKTTEKEFKIPASKDPDSHSTRFVLVDENLTIRGFYDGFEVKSIYKLTEDAKNLFDEVPLS